MLKIAVMSLGNIALKAYMPLYIANQDLVEFHFYTRDPEKLAQLQARYQLRHCYSDLEALENVDLDAVMIHSPTHVHAKMIDWAFDRHLHVFVDKPISDDYAEVKRLLKRAEKQNRVLFTGFNRRYAPFNKKLKAVENKNLILAEKHREQTKQDAKFALFDMMIHMVDTALYLLDAPIIDAHLSVKTDSDQSLKQAIIQLETESTTALSMINMYAGARPETVKVMSPTAGINEVIDLDTLIINQGQEKIQQRFPDWTDVLVRRGFSDMFQDFIAKVKADQAIDNQLTQASHYWVDKLYQKI